MAYTPSDVTQFSSMFQSDPGNAYFQQYGAFPTDTAGQASWFNRAQSGGAQEQQRQAANDKGGLFGGGLGSLLGLAGLAFGIPAGLEWLGGLGGAEAGMASTAFGGTGGLEALNAFEGASALNPTFASAGSAGAAAGLADTAMNVAPGGAMDMFGSMNPSGAGSAFTGTGVGGFLSNLITSPVGTIANAAKSLFSGTGGSNSNLWGTGGNNTGSVWGPLSSIASLAMGAYGLSESDKLKKAAMAAAASQDPFGSQRPQYQQQMATLMANPSSITSVPGFDAGRLALDRSLAAQGYNPATTKIPGNYIDAQSNYGGKFFNDYLTRLMTLSGANISPSGGNLAYGGATDSSMMNIQAMRNLIAGTRGLAGG